MPTDFDTISGFTVAGLIAMGGTVGFLKAGSVPSLVAGVTSGAVLAYGTLRASRSYKDVYVVLGITLFLTFFMGRRFLRSGKFMPSGIVSVLALVTFLRFGSRLL